MRNLDAAADDRENQNIPDKPLHSPVFETKWIDNLYDPSRFYDNKSNNVYYVFITVDPSAGRDVSNYVISSMYYIRNSDNRTYTAVVFYYINYKGHSSLILLINSE